MRSSLRILLLLLSLPFFAPSAVRAQDAQAQASGMANAFNAAASKIFWFAWPTATYRSWSLDGIHVLDHGIRVSVKLSGLSHWDGSDLWLKLSLDYQNGQFGNLQVVDHNAVVPPFFTSGALAKAAVFLASQSASNTQPQTSSAPPPAPPPPVPASVEAVCLINPINGDLTFNYRSTQWTQVTLKSGYFIILQRAHSSGTAQPAALEVAYKDGQQAGSLDRDYDLPSALVSTTSPACDAVPNYHFGLDGGSIRIYTGKPAQ